MDNNSVKLFVVFAKAYNAYTKRLKTNAKYLGFSISEFAVLSYLYNKKNSVNVQELSDKILLSNSTTAYTIDKLIKRELVDKKENSLDKRFVEIYLTKLGKKAIEEIFPTHVRFLEKLNPLTDEETEELIALLKKVGKNQ